MKLTVYNPHSREAAASAATRIQELEMLLSVTEEDSGIYAANHSGGTPVTVSQDTFRLLTRALELCESTGGALDVTILPVLQAWGFTTDAYRVPGEQELSKLLERVDYRKFLWQRTYSPFRTVCSLIWGRWRRGTREIS